MLRSTPTREPQFQMKTNTKETKLDFKRIAIEEVRNVWKGDVDIEWLADVIEKWYARGKDDA